jgi:hypothetical protein
VNETRELCGRNMNDTAEYQQPVCIKQLALENGTELEIRDASRPLAGDRWQVAAVFRLTVPITSEMLSGSRTPADVAEIRRLFGERLVFEKRLERTFIDKSAREKTFEQMVDSYRQRALQYISKPAFARNYVLKQYAEAVRKSTWYPNQP